MLIKKFFIFTIFTISLTSISLFADDFEDEFKTELVVKKKPLDPLESYNRFMTDINDKIYINLLNPLSSGYEKITPQVLRVGISNIFDNLFFPISFTNNLLQLKFQNSLSEFQRFIINSTLGLAGFNDIATTNFSIEKHQEDFGQTLGHYGVGNDIYIIIPILGPSNLRDLIGSGVDYFIDPIAYHHNIKTIPKNSTDANYLKASKGFNEYSLNYKNYENLKQNAIDLYPLIKNVYEQHRDKKISE